MDPQFPDNFAIVDERVWRGARPTAAQARCLYDAGVRTSLNLEWERADDGLFPTFVRLARVRDFEPLPWFAPSLARAHVDRALAEIAAGPAIVYVHCRSGQNRTGVVVAAYRLIVLKHPLASVLQDFASYRGLWAWGDERFIEGLT